MKRKVLFSIVSNGDHALNQVRARHIEQFRDSLAVHVTASAKFSQGRVGHASVEISIVVSHCGTTLVIEESGEFKFNPSNDSESYTSFGRISIGDQSLEIGFGGKFTSRRNCGWLPEYLYIKIEP